MKNLKHYKNNRKIQFVIINRLRSLKIYRINIGILINNRLLISRILWEVKRL